MANCSVAPRRIGRNAGAVGIAAAVLLAAIPSRAESQTRVAPGAWVRVSTDSSGDSHLAGRLLSITRDSIVLGEVDPRVVDRFTTRELTIALPMTSVRRIDLRTESHNHAWMGLGIGALSGAVVFGVAGLRSGPSCNANSVSCALTERETHNLLGLAGAGVGAMAGGVIGLLIGVAVVTEQWTPADIKGSTSLGLTPASNGIGVRISYSFR